MNGIPCNTDTFSQEIKVLLGELSVERNELDVQLNERRAQLSVLKKDIRKEEENLQGILGQITKHKMGMAQDLWVLCRLGRSTQSSLVLLILTQELLFNSPH